MPILALLFGKLSADMSMILTNVALAQSGHTVALLGCPLSGVKRTSADLCNVCL